MNVPAFSRTDSKFKKFLSVMLIILAVHGTFGFMMFVWEEGMQTAMFAAFAYNTAKDYDGLEKHINEVMIPTHEGAEFWIKNFGWPAVLMYPAYMQYLESNRGYIKSAQALVEKNKGKVSALAIE